MPGRKYPIVGQLELKPCMNGPALPVNELEAELLKEACAGDSARESAERRGLSEITVTHMITEIWKNLGCKNKKEMIGYCKEKGYDKLVVMAATVLSHLMEERENCEIMIAELFPYL